METDVENSGEGNVIIFDGMAVTNRIDIKKEKVKTCSDFAVSFVNIITRESQSYDEVRVIFDRYVASSLKYTTRTKRTHGVSDESKIGHLTTKQLLAKIETKNDLTKHIAEKLASSLNTVDYVIVFGNNCKTNMNINQDLHQYNQEEAHTGIVLHALMFLKEIHFPTCSFPAQILT